jgi:hypothetical protein
MTRIALLIALVASLAAVGCGGESESDRPGNPAVYERIDTLKSCAKLQREFDTAMTNHERDGSDVSLAYAEHAQSRIETLDCP